MSEHVRVNQPLDPITDILGVDLTAERLAENLETFRAILAEIQKLRSLDLTDVHPAIVFDPLIPYRRERVPSPRERESDLRAERVPIPSPPEGERTG